jgi:regulator of sigma D
MLDTQDEESSPFTIDESNKLVNLLDSLTAAEIEYYNSKNNSSTGAVRLFSTLENRIDLYGSLKETIKALLDELTNDYVAIADQKDQLDLQKQLRSNIYLLEKAYTNFGDIEKSVNEKQGKGIIAYHIKKSRFRIVQEELLEDPTDLENTRILQDYKGNVIDPKKLAAPSTLSIISSIFRKDKQEDGTVIESLDVFGIPELEDISVMWSKLSRILAGSFDYAEMYRRLQNNLENYPEFQQILDMLRAPEIVKTSDKLQFKLETNFWQDFKKPRVNNIS